MQSLIERGNIFRKELKPEEQTPFLEKPIVQYGIGVLGIIVFAVGLYLVADSPVQKTDESKDDFDARVNQLTAIGWTFIVVGLLHIAGSVYLIWKTRNVKLIRSFVSSS